MKNAKEIKKAKDLPGSKLSFNPFLDYLRTTHAQSTGLRQDYITQTIDKYTALIRNLETDSSNGNSAVCALFELTNETLSFRLEETDSSFDVYMSPAWNKLLFIKENLPGILAANDERISFLKSIDEQILNKKDLLPALCYRAIWGHFVDFPCLLLSDTMLSYSSITADQVYYFRLDADFNYIQINTELPFGDCKQIIEEIDANALTEEETIVLLEARLPLDNFSFTGFGKFTIIDITVPHIIKLIDRQLDTSDYYAKSLTYLKDIRKALTIVAGNNGLKFGLLPMFELNGKFIFSEHFSNDQQAGSMDVASQKNLFDFLVNVYRQKPSRIYLKEIIDDLAAKYLYLKTHRENGIQSFALLPIFYHGRFVGVLEVFTKNPDDLSRATLSKLETFFPVLSTIFNRSIEKLERTIGEVIKNKFTSLQPSVQWRFNQAAWRYLQDCKAQPEPIEIEEIEFDQVYPVYGAIDIKNSTVNRNRALRDDAVFHLQLLYDTLTKLRDSTSFSLLEERIADCKKWQNLIHDESLALQEGELNYFLEDDIYCFLKELTKGKPEITAITDNYFSALNDADGQASARRRMLENSMSMVISNINVLIDNLNLQAQKDFPCFFEKFRTDGVEYDIYIGQSVAPDRPFNHIFIKNLRLLQLTNMIAIANRTQQLQAQLSIPVEITQLIFVNPNCIDIRFRRDERRFDVEGAYNIRYHIVKKRIDKVLIKNTTERLTAPGKIAIVYTNQKEADEYLVHIRFLQTQALLTDDIELLELEQLQGVIGLKAIRVAIRYSDK